MTFVEKSLQIYKNILDFKPNSSNSLPENVYFLNDDLILCKDRNYGDSRYPYTNDGLTLWAHASGNIQVNESNFFVFGPTLEGKQPAASFFGGVKNNDGTFDFVSITGNSDTILSYDAPKYVVYHKSYALYFREYKGVLFVFKTGVDKEKNILFSSCAINLSKEEKEIYIASYFNPLLIHADVDCEESKWFKNCTLKSYGASFLAIEDLSRSIHHYNYGIFKRSYSEFSKISSTTSRERFASKRHNHITLSEGLRNGRFSDEKIVTQFSDTAILSDIVSNTVKENEKIVLNYMVSRASSEEEAENIEKTPYTTLVNEFAFDNLENDPNNKNVQNLKINFGPFNELKIDNELFNKFIASVINQVDYCSKAKNSSLALLGVRDVFQMIEASLIWDKEFAREKILQALNFVDKTGQAPRQYAYHPENNVLALDNREFIDQGQWIISTIYTYLAFTNDYSILNERCKFTHLLPRAGGSFRDGDGTVFEHVQALGKYLLSHLDKDTKCLHTLYGDWNDAVDGLGTSSDPEHRFGDGVSAMATMHLYKNLYELKAIYSIAQAKDDVNFDKLIKEVEEGINKHLIVSDGKDKRIIHGWGEHKEFLVGSFNDVDNISRDSLTSNAFYVISKMIETKPELKQTILDAYSRLDSKYGYLTFSHYFDRASGGKVGRIINLPKGTAENAATYIHSTLFGIRSLLLMDECDEAYRQLYKILPITHSYLTHSPFVMPNSYVYNPEIGVDGESMNDWYTGSSNTILKAIVFDLFGINPLMGDAIEIKPVSKFPSNAARIELDIKNKHFIIEYNNNGKANRTITLNGKVIGNTFSAKDCGDSNIIKIED